LLTDFGASTRELMLSAYGVCASQLLQSAAEYFGECARELMLSAAD